tara:strand:+ start:2816 stop:3085 length:270 start_codon:yes stop_codon:yes gene_type:complete
MAGPKRKAWDGIEKPKKPEKDKFVLRLPDGLRDQIKDSAKLNERSMNAEMIYRLKETFKPAMPTLESCDDDADKCETKYDEYLLIKGAL